LNPQVAPFFHAPTNTWSYVVSDVDGGIAAIIDPVLDFDAASGVVSAESARALLAHVHTHRLRVALVLETHAHADHLSAADWLKRQLAGEGTPPQLCIGAGITAVQQHFRAVFALGEEFRADGSQFDRLLRDGERLPLGALQVEVLATPGHTADSLSYRIGDAVFVGDTLFSPAAGSARCDFPGGDAAALYRSIRRLYALPDTTRLFLCHDYPPAGASPRSEIPLGEMRASNIHVRSETTEADYVALRTGRDATLAVPRLLYPALQVNIRAGALPPGDAAGRLFLKLPLRAPHDE
jgi:glyoxylase-like metal-dependent hydrolase (beta-lactamase superfamily II)